jgi:SAM-dependent methyltransferase
LHAVAFDPLAAGYDAEFTHSPLGEALRAIVWARFDAVFAQASSVLDLGCGTGEDAVRLARAGVRVTALDASEAMVQRARHKAREHGCAERIEFHCLPMERLGEALPQPRFDGVLSNFGALNCVSDLGALLAALAPRLARGARLLWVPMGRYVPWEWAWYLLRARPDKAGRRLGRARTPWRGLSIGYPTPRELTALLRPSFRIDAVRPLGFALPPSFAGPWVARHPRLFAALTRLEHAGQSRAFLASLADHYILEATHVGADENGA